MIRRLPHMTRLCVLLYILHAATVAAVTPWRITPNSSNADEDNTAAVTGLITASLNHQLLNYDGLSRLLDALSAQTPQFISPFDDLSQLDQQVMDKQLQRLLTEGRVETAQVTRWLADTLGVQHRTQSQRTQHAADTAILGAEMNFAHLPIGTMVVPKFMGGKTLRFDEEIEILTTPVTQGQWYKQMGTVPFVHVPSYNIRNSPAINPFHPAERVTLYEIELFIRKLNRQNDGYLYRLPTHAEWLYAYTDGGHEPHQVGWKERTWRKFIKARVEKGVFGRAPDGSSGETITDFGWYKENSNTTTHPVAQLKPIVIHHPDYGAQSIWDMNGNVSEITQAVFPVQVLLEDFNDPLYWAQIKRSQPRARYVTVGGSYDDQGLPRYNDLSMNPWEQFALNTPWYASRGTDPSADRYHGFRLVRTRVKP